jgi:trans-aconitate methyltransferase
MKLASAERRLVDWLAQLPDLPSWPVLRVLDLGCGNAASAHAIRQCWPDAAIMGVDQDFRTLTAAPPFVCTLHADVRRLPFDQPVFSLIIIRHPDVFRRPDSWQKAINRAGQLLHRNGCLLVTCYSLPEAKRIDTWLRNDWAQYGQNIPLRHDTITPADIVDHDRFAFAWQLMPPANKTQ